MTKTKTLLSNDINKLVLEDLKRSGLDAKDQRKLRVVPLSPGDVQELTKSAKHDGFRAAGYQLTYFDVNGEPTDFWRIRFLDKVEWTKGGRKKTLRYAQAEGTEPLAYFAPYVDWKTVFTDTATTIVFTEGEKKAAKACKEGFATIGLGGVWSFRSAKLGRELIDDLAAIGWEGRNVLLIFDSEVNQKAEVEGALETLGRTLERRGAIVGRVSLPLEGAEKVGLDDYLVKHSAAELRALPVNQLHSDATLDAFNKECAVIADPPSIVVLATKRLHRNPDVLSSIAYADRTMTKVAPSGQLQTVSAFKEWLAWPKRRSHSAVVYEPGKPEVIPSTNALNLWSGWGVAPKRGDVSNWKRLLDYMFHKKDDERGWFERWLAYPLQYPGTKQYAAAVLWSRDTGTGKTLVGMSMSRIYGANWAMIGEEHLHGSFNDWQAHKQFVLAEEVSGSDKRAEANRLKRIITSEVCRINRKFEAAYETADCVNYLFNSNHCDSFLLEDKDRRFFVHEVGVGAEKPSVDWFTNTYNDWYKSEAGAAALFDYLLKLDLGSFNPRAKAPVTAARDEMVELSGGEADQAVRDALRAPDHYLRVGDAPIQKDLFTYDELVELLDPVGRKRLTKTGLARALGRQDVRSHVVRIGKSTLRIVAMRNQKKWDTASHADLVAAFTNEPPKSTKF